jgi:hypothetical protein
MGIKNGLSAIDARLREPVADRLFLSTADGGRCITDAVRETYEICRIANQLSQTEPVLIPKHGARFHFELPGSVQGFQIDQDGENSSGLTLSNVAGGSATGQRSLALDFEGMEEDRPVRIATPTFIPLDSKVASHYSLMACPTLFPGQVIQGRLAAGRENSAPVRIVPFVAGYDGNDELARHYGSPLTLAPGAGEDFQWQIEEIGGAPIARFGFELRSDRLARGRIHFGARTPAAQCGDELGSMRSIRSAPNGRPPFICLRIGVPGYSFRGHATGRIIRSKRQSCLIQPNPSAWLPGSRV